MTEILIGNDGLVVRDSGIWVKEKLYYLEHYLRIFSVGMHNKWPGKLYYIDLFAGPGRCLIRDSQEEIDGSPLIALRFDFAKYFFFEADTTCHEALVKRVASCTSEKRAQIEIIQGDCNEKIDSANLPEEGLGLAFIDPTGISPLAFDTVRKLTANRNMDLIINFHEGMGIRMNLHQYAQSRDTALDTFMGSDRWRQKFLQAPTSFDQICREITNEYFGNLRSLGYQIADGEQIPVKTEQNALLYYLLFASKHPRGNDFWRKIGRIDPRGQRKLF